MPNRLTRLSFRTQLPKVIGREMRNVDRMQQAVAPIAIEALIGVFLPEDHRP